MKEITPTPCGSNIPTVKPQNALFSILSYYLSLPPIYNQKMSSQSAYLSLGYKAPPRHFLNKDSLYHLSIGPQTYRILTVSSLRKTSHSTRPLPAPAVFSKYLINDTR